MISFIKAAWRLIRTPIDPRDAAQFGHYYDSRRHPDIDRIDTDVRDAFAEASIVTWRTHFGTPQPQINRITDPAHPCGGHTAETYDLERAGDDMRRARRFDREDADLKCWKICERLRADEGDSVTLLCDNPDGDPNNAVECCGMWTAFEPRRFEGDTILAALTLAVATYEEQRRQ